MSEGLALACAFAESRPQAAARALEEMPSVEAALFLASLPAETAAPVIDQMSPGAAARRLSAMEPEEAGAVLAELDGRSCGAILRACSADPRRVLLRQLPARRARHFRRSLAYTLDLVGAWIEYDVPALPAEQTAGDALALLRRRDKPNEAQVFLYGAARRFAGSVTLTRLLRARADAPLSGLREPSIRALSDGVDIDEVEHLPDWDDSAMLPVTAPDGSLLGGLSRAGLRRALRSVFPELPPSEPESLLAHLFTAYLRTGSELIRLLIGRASTGPVASAPDER